MRAAKLLHVSECITGIRGAEQNFEPLNYATVPRSRLLLLCQPHIRPRWAARNLTSENAADQRAAPPGLRSPGISMLGG